MKHSYIISSLMKIVVASMDSTYFLGISSLKLDFSTMRQKKRDSYGKIGDDITAKPEKDYVIYRSACSRWR